MPESVSIWLEQLKGGDADAAQNLWDRYFKQLLGVAKRKLVGASTRRADEEDIAVQVFHSFFKAAESNRFPKLDSRDDLWQILMMLTARKVAAQRKHENAQKRGSGKTRGESVFLVGDGNDLASVIGEAPGDSFAAELMEELREAVKRLGDDSLEKVAVMKFQGYSNQEIADELSCHSRSVERKLRLIRKIWSD